MRTVALILWPAAAITAAWILHHAFQALAAVILRRRHGPRRPGFEVKLIDGPGPPEEP